MSNNLGEASQWHAKYDAEAQSRLEEIEELRRKFTCRIQEQEEHIETLLVKVNNLEKQKSRLQSEIEVLIIDLERANGTARELQKRVDVLERTNIELKTRLEETVTLYETAQRDLRNKQAELTRVNHELDKTKDQRDGLARDNKKLGGELSLSKWTFNNFTAYWIFGRLVKFIISNNFQKLYWVNVSFFLFCFIDEVSEARVTITEITRRYHELEVELRRLENERDELTAAYKEAEAVNLLNLTYFDSFCLQIVFFFATC